MQKNLDVVIQYQKPPDRFFYCRSLCLYKLGLFDDALKDCDKSYK